MNLLDILKINNSERLTIISKEVGIIFDGWFESIDDLLTHDKNIKHYFDKKIKSFDAYEYDHIRIFLYELEVL